jgi:hypothetical protein
MPFGRLPAAVPPFHPNPLRAPRVRDLYGRIVGQVAWQPTATGTAIRVAVQLPPGRFERWAAATVEAIGRERGIELAGLFEPAPGERVEPAGGGLSRRIFAAYAAADRRTFPLGDDPLAPAPRPTATPPGDLGDVDLVIALAPSVSRPLPLTPRFGAWAIRFGEHTPRGAGVPGFWEMHSREATLITSVELEAEGGRPSAVLEQARTALDLISLNRSRGTAARKAPHLVRHALHRLRRDGPAALTGSRPGVPREALGLPPPRTLLAHCIRVGGGALLRRIQQRLYQHRWQVAFRPLHDDGERGIPDPAAPDWRPLAAPLDRFWADPFVIEEGDRHWLFVEEYDYRSGRAAIAVCELSADGSASKPEVVLALGHHVSYPFVFEHGDAVFMLPETVEIGGIRLYRAHAFPRDWRLEGVLVEDLRASDPTLVRHDGRFWLFAGVQDSNERYADELWVWWADDLFGPWQPHALNPVVSDVRCARPAGALFRRDGALVRPGQDCSRGYGHAITLNEVEILTTDEYRERQIGRIDPGVPRSVRAIHSVNADGAFEVIDVNRRLPRFAPSRMRGRGRDRSDAARAP